MSELVIPKFDGGSLLNVPSTIIKLFGGNPPKKELPVEYYESVEGVEKVILFLVDGFGDNLFNSEAIKYSPFKLAQERGFYHQITSGFPPTTAASLGMVNSGLSVLEHGLPEWYIYFRETGCVMHSLPFKPLISTEVVGEVESDILFDRKTIYEGLAEVGVKSFVLSPRQYVGTLYTNSFSKGATVVGYSTLSNFMISLREILQTPGKVYVYAYWPHIDGAEHEFGIGTENVNSEVSLFSFALANEFIGKLDSEIAKKTALMITADHGHIATNPEETFYLEKIPGLVDNFKTDKNGRIIPPSGGPFNVFLNIKEGKIDETMNLLKEALKGKAEIYTMKEVIEKGWFGTGEMHPEFLNRVGDILVLSIDEKTIWYHFAPDVYYKLHGNHGGLSPKTMQIPFICAKVSELKV